MGIATYLDNVVAELIESFPYEDIGKLNPDVTVSNAIVVGIATTNYGPDRSDGNSTFTIVTRATFTDQFLSPEDLTYDNILETSIDMLAWSRHRIVSYGEGNCILMPIGLFQQEVEDYTNQTFLTRIQYGVEWACEIQKAISSNYRQTLDLTPPLRGIYDDGSRFWPSI